MIKYLLQRPVAVLVIFTAMVLFGTGLIFKVPVSLLPAIDVPRMLIRVNYPNASAQQLERQVLKPIRDELSVMNNLTNIQTDASNHLGLVNLYFDYRADMSLAYIEVNEKIDRLSGRFPSGMERPQVVRISTSDIPVIRVQIIPGDNADYQEVSELTEKVFKRRLEQLSGVSVVDLNGQGGSVVSIFPDWQRMNAYNVDLAEMISTVSSVNQDNGGLNLKDGQYRYFIRLENQVKSIQDLENLNIPSLSGNLIPLRELAKLQVLPADAMGFHLFNGKKGMVITVQGQAESRMNDLVPLIRAAVNDFKKQYPSIEFNLSQDQSFLLDAGIDNLKQDILIGGLMTIALLFLFLGNFASPVLMSISIPVSLLITFIFFYAFGLSFNIISLSGLALGVGMLIDNSIVVIGHITRKRISNLPPLDSAVQGTNEMAIPVIGQVLTTVVVYAPLVLLNGLSGALIADQSIALTISLCVSLLVAFVLTPMLYKLLLKTPPEKLKDDTIFYKWVSNGYHLMISFILLHRRKFLILTLTIMPIGCILAYYIPFDSLPYIEKKESLVKINWNEPIDAQENLQRTNALLSNLKQIIDVSEAEVATTKFLFQAGQENMYGTQIYYAAATENKKEQADTQVRSSLKAYPKATVEIIDAPNAFTQLFANDAPYLMAKFKPMSNHAEDEDFEKLLGWLQQHPEIKSQQDQSTVKAPSLVASLNLDKMNIYHITKTAIEQELSHMFGNTILSEMTGTGIKKNILLGNNDTRYQDRLNTTIRNTDGIAYPLRDFVAFEPSSQFVHISADKDGAYKAVLLADQPAIEKKMQQIKSMAASFGFSTDFLGRYYSNRELMKQMVFIFLIVLALLYTVLALQFESFTQPIVVMMTIPLGITGATFLLLLSGGSFNVMSAIGFVVVLGLIVDDPILKIETLNRLSKIYAESGHTRDESLLKKMIHEAGDICLKPLLMVSLTTSIALVPVLFIGGIGNDLQRPMAVVIIGGLTIGTFFTTWFIPLAYWYLQKWTLKKTTA